MLTLERYEEIGDWYAVSPRIDDADIEGPADEMLALADAIERRSEVKFKRCAAEWTANRVWVWSPRNSQERTGLSHRTALALAAEIRRMLGGK